MYRITRTPLLFLAAFSPHLSSEPATSGPRTTPLASPEGGHNDFDLSDAVKESCNVWFSEASNPVGIDAIEETLKLLGLAQPTGGGLPNEGSFVDSS